MSAQNLPQSTVPLSPADLPGSPLAQALTQPLLIGVFLKLAENKGARPGAPGHAASWSFEHNERIVLRAEALGFDLAFAPMRWLPKGQDDVASLDSFIVLAAMAAITERLLLISTTHVLYGPIHPVHLAKWGATLDHISKGRWGINIVTGHRAVEHEMFGRPQIEHDQRYERAAELFDVVLRLWAENENYSYSGNSPWQLHDAYISPKPLYGRPIMVNATGSDAGIDFAARYSDLVFVTSPGGPNMEEALATLPAHNARIKQAAQRIGRRVRTIINPVIVSRDTPGEAQEYAESIVRNAVPSKDKYASDAHAWRGRDDPSRKPGKGIGGNIEIIGSPEQVVEQLQALKAAGIDGVQIGFPDFATDLDYFGARILPLLKQAGLRLDTQETPS
jgi:alkanesulfonate monooxygenase SsuD/methylene tetrahydromethanopterin reductase-like flavin-dependent oxidoreductase (luciferase family)